MDITDLQISRLSMNQTIGIRGILPEGHAAIRPHRLEKLRYRRFQANFTINDRHHPFFVFVHSATSVELEKWDDSEVLPDDDAYVKIAIEDTEEF
ncbi:hypothetical protein [Bosea sp. Root670]|uniref:hypothetical protein n=1 Tax=Bosea sp. Root670 TaxID=1736583 RepID=UPI00138F57AE|nr:hypothetical protein [Bosea sp. Root670]